MNEQEINNAAAIMEPAHELLKRYAAKYKMESIEVTAVFAAMCYQAALYRRMSEDRVRAEIAAEMDGTKD